MQQPQWYEVKGKGKLVCRLKKSLCGLKQDPRQWYLKFGKFMTEQSYSICHYDHYVYFKRLNDGSYTTLYLYVDDIIVAGSNMQEINVLKRKLEVQSYRIVQQVQQQWSYCDQSPSGRLLGVETNYIPDFRGLSSAEFGPHNLLGGVGGISPPLLSQGGIGGVVTCFGSPLSRCSGEASLKGLFQKKSL